MRSLSELTGKDLFWKIQPGSAHIPDQAQHSYVLFMGDEPVVQAQVIWQRMVSYEVIMESGEGTYEVHMDLAVPERRSVVNKAGLAESAATFELASENMVTATGWITTASSRKLAWAPTHEISYEYVIFVPGGPRLITLAAAASMSIGGNPGEMTLAPEMAGDAELAPLVALGFALANEQTYLIHRDMNAPPGSLNLSIPEGMPKNMGDVLRLLGETRPGSRSPSS
ncbi:MAG TPA: hypothetical protein VGU71_11300 [Candidatus Dormibacteraeota bacterium]|nr:hypothetical protein [Candidatus Dormibacteraeota bacterium]